MTPAVLKLVEDLRASGELFGRFGHVVARDACHEVGCELRVTSNRTVPIRKSNRRSKPRDVAGAVAAIAEMERLDLFDAQAIARVINAPPDERLRGAFIMPTEPDPIRRIGAQDISFHVSGGSIGWFGSAEWDSDRIFREIETPADLGEWALDDWIQIGTERFAAGDLIRYAQPGQRLGDAVVESVRGNTITLRPPTTRQTAAMFCHRHLKRAPDPRAKPSRVPEQLQRQRLDGRRRR